MLVDKPAGPTSHDVVARARRGLKERSIGHTGTLDPFATGLLVLLVGRATRLARFVEQQAKTYVAVARLGIETATDDLTGAITREAMLPPWPTDTEVAAALAGFVGVQEQVPPVFSAKKVGGERSYRLARAGRPAALAPVPITVHCITLVAWAPPRLTFRCTVAAGTYVRALARDLGRVLGVGAHLESLRREAIGPLGVDAAMSLEALDDDKAAFRLLTPDAVLGHLPSVDLTQEQLEDVRHGRPVQSAAVAHGTVRLRVETGLVAVAEARDGLLYPRVVLESG